MDFLLKVGNDNGNSEHDIYIENKLFRQPNVYAQTTNFNSYDDENPLAVIENIMDKILVGIQSKSISGTFLIGKSAIDSGIMVDEMHVGFDGKANSDLPVINTLGTIAAYSVKKYFDENNKTIPEKLSVAVEMATALPVFEYYDDANNKVKFEQNFMEGPHIVVLHLGNKRVVVEIEFTGIFVLPEAAPVTEALVEIKKNDEKAIIFEDFNNEYFSDSPVDGSYFADKKILHTDIGDGTTELPVTEEGFPKTGFTTGRSLGAGHAISDALNEIRKVTKNPNLKRQEVSEIIRGRKLEKWKEKTMIALQPAIEKQVNEIIAAIKEEVRKTLNDVDIIMVYGGGSILMKEVLYPKLLEICNEMEIKLLYIPESYAVVMNAEGLNAFVHSEAFEFIIADKKKKRLAEVNS